MNSIIVLQARTSSTRLPCKVLLPIREIPLAVLAAKRAANRGRNVIVATSDDPSDNGLADILQAHGLRFFRGSLTNTLDRVVKALSEYDDKTLVFRLTADNVFPDGELLDEVEHEFLDRKLEYLCCNGLPSGLPYGMSVELTRLQHLREAARFATSDHDHEHVTPFVIRKYGNAYFLKHKKLQHGHYRCTIDCLDDYLGIQALFSDIPDPIQVRALDLVPRLSQIPFQPIAKSPTPKLVLGTAQLGCDYGIANTSGQPTLALAQHLIKTAIANGVTYLDTASAYGNSEEVIGHALKSGWMGRATVITKLAPLQDCPADAPPQVIDAFIDASIFKSCASLNSSKLEVLMLHRASHLTDMGGAIWQRLLKYRTAGRIGKLGVSVQSPAELIQALSIADIEFIQMPFNLLDWRWDAAIEKIREAKTTRELVIHIRSALLQGLLPSPNTSHWQRAHVEDPSALQKWLINQVNCCERHDIADLCLGYVNALDWVDGITVGIENMGQLTENIHNFNREPLNPRQVSDIQVTRPKLAESTLNPALWKRKGI